MSKFRDVRVLNLLFSAAILIFGVMIYWFWEPNHHFSPPYLLYGFEFWLIQWVLWVATYGLMQNKSSDIRSILSTIVLHTVLALGICLALGMGEGFYGPRTLINLVIIFGLLVSWNFLFGTWAMEKDATEAIQTLWLLPSMTVSLGSLVAWGIISVQRFGLHAVLFAVVCFGYTVLQMPSYTLLFLPKNRQTVDTPWLMSLAYGKLLLGLTFYSFYILEKPLYNHRVSWDLHLGTFFATDAHQKLALAVVGPIVTLSVSKLGNLILDYIRKMRGPAVDPTAGAA